MPAKGVAGPRGGDSPSPVASTTSITAFNADPRTALRASNVLPPCVSAAPCSRPSGTLLFIQE
jgi:hypothetical protein